MDSRIRFLLVSARNEIDEALGLLDGKTVQAGLERWDNALNDLESTCPTGAWGMSDETARAQIGSTGGVGASQALVQINSRRAVPDGYWNRVIDAARSYGIPSAVLMAIFCRESHHGHALDASGYGDHGLAFGVGQVDARYHDQRGTPDPYSLEHMAQCAELFAQFMCDVERKHEGWADPYILKGACVAYNSGLGNVVTIDRMDRGTTGNDYGADVMARAKVYKELWL